jgi:hypothetical protein
VGSHVEFIEEAQTGLGSCKPPGTRDATDFSAVAAFLIGQCFLGGDRVQGLESLCFVVVVWMLNLSII